MTAPEKKSHKIEAKIRDALAQHVRSVSCPNGEGVAWGRVTSPPTRESARPQSWLGRHMRALVLGQESGAYNMAVPHQGGTSLMFPQPSKNPWTPSAAGSEDVVRTLGDSGYLSHSPRGSVVGRFSDSPPSYEEASLMGASLGSTEKSVPVHAVGDYVPLDWSKPNSGTATRQVMKDINRLRPEQYKALDARIRKPAGGLLDFDRNVSLTKGSPVRPDLMNLLQDLGQGGFARVKRGLKSGAAYPALIGGAGLGLINDDDMYGSDVR